MFEQLHCKQVTVKLDHIFSSLSTAYRKGHICETTLLRLNEDWKLAIDGKELVCILSTHMSKAFDSLSHSPTLTKLEAYGFESSALDLTRLSLTTAKMFNPLLWNVFQNDLPCSITTTKLSIYVDDHQLYTSGTNFTA